MGTTTDTSRGKKNITQEQQERIRQLEEKIKNIEKEK